MKRFTLLVVVSFICSGLVCSVETDAQTSPVPVEVRIDPSQDLGAWEGWGSSLAWWGRAIGGTGNADFYADLIYTTKLTDGYPGLGLNIVRYNLGGGGIKQLKENKGPKLQWQMDIHGYWADPKETDPSRWDWSVDSNQRSMMMKAHDRGADIFEMFSDSPMWWMNSNHSTAGSETGGDCLAPGNVDLFAAYLANVARHAVDDWGIKFDSVEPFNEPSAMWWKYPGRQEGCHFDLPTQQAVIQKLREQLNRVGLNAVAVAAADENDIDAGLATWNAYDESTRICIGKVNVHGYSHGTDPYRGANRPALRRVVGDRRLWQSEYGDSDGTGYTMAESIVRDIKELRPTAWVYWQPVEPESGWGMLNANYVDTHDQFQTREKTSLVRVNQKFYVYGQFTRYLRPAYRMLKVDNDSVAAFDPAEHKLVIIKVTGNSQESVRYDLSRFKVLGKTVQQVATTTAPGAGIPDWKQQAAAVNLVGKDKRSFVVTLFPKSVYTFVIDEVSF